VDSARAILALVRVAETTLADLSHVRRGTLTVFASQTIASYWLPRHLVAFHTRYPQIDLRLEVGNTAQCVRAVTMGSADLGFVEGGIDEPRLQADLIAKDRLVAVVGCDHPWFSVTPDLPQALFQTEWALREPGSGTRSSFEDGLRSLGVAPEGLRVAMELPSNEAICTAVETSKLATVVSQSVADAGIRVGRLKVLPLDLPSRDFRIIRHKERHQSRAGKAFVDLLAQAVPV
jgi:DNA-binding transcriptional LysR family regulator